VNTATVFNIQRFSLHDGPGIRTTVFLKGCPLACPWCHNPESRDPRPQLALHPERCLGCGICVPVCRQGTAGPLGTPGEGTCTACGACAEACPAEARDLLGRPWTVDALLAEVLRDRDFYGPSGGGVTFSGGEPLTDGNAAFVLACLAALRRHGVPTAVDTCGHVDTDVLLEAAALTDLVLYDLKLMDDADHRRHCGVGNGLIRDNLARLVATDVEVRVRVPLIPGLTDTPGNLAAIAGFVAGLPRRPEVHLLPYHGAGAGKYERLGMSYALAHAAAPGPDDLAHAARTFTDHGLAVTCGG
jgi:pyruvate formate lyase activating enzyme